MKAYTHTGKGHYVGSVCVVLAESQKEAEKIIRDYLDRNGLSDENLNIQECSLGIPVIIYAQNGDY